MSDWKPIETAPMDGTDVLLFGPKGPHGRTNIYAVDWYRLPSDDKGFVGWGKFNAQYWPPTHWMPLPEPPRP